MRAAIYVSDYKFLINSIFQKQLAHQNMGLIVAWDLYAFNAYGSISYTRLMLMAWGAFFF